MFVPVPCSVGRHHSIKAPKFRGFQADFFYVIVKGKNQLIRTWNSACE